MNSILKGNFKLKTKDLVKPDGESPEKTNTQEFEEKSMERLGGSIAFVMKKNKFIWDDSEND